MNLSRRWHFNFNVMRFDTYEEAKAAAVAKMEETSSDRWNVI